MAEAIAREKGHHVVSAGTDPQRIGGVAENALTVLEKLVSKHQDCTLNQLIL